MNDFTGNRIDVKAKLKEKLGTENYKFFRNPVSGNDIMIEHKTLKGEKGKPLQIGFNLGDKDAIQRVMKIINKNNQEVTLPTN